MTNQELMAAAYRAELRLKSFEQTVSQAYGRSQDTETEQ